MIRNLFKVSPFGAIGEMRIPSAYLFLIYILTIVSPSLAEAATGDSAPSVPAGTTNATSMSRKLSDAQKTLRQCISVATPDMVGTSPSGQEPYALAALAAVQYFQAVAKRKVTVRRSAEALSDFLFLVELCNRYLTLKQSDRRLPFQERLAVDDFSGAKLKGKEFIVNGQPVMLLGPLGYNQLANEIDWVKKFGFRIIGDDFNNYASINAMSDPSKADRAAFVRLSNSWKSLRAQGLFVIHNPTLHYLSQSALRQFPDIVGGHRPEYPNLYGGFVPYSFESSTMKKLITGYYKTLFEMTRTQQSFPLIWLMNEPTYDRLTDPGFIRKYRKFLEVKFSNISALNQAWKTNFKSFQSISGDAKETVRDQFDFASFRQDYLTSWVKWLYAEVKRQEDSVIVSNKPMAHRLFDLDGGVDFEAEADFLDVPGSDAYRNPSRKIYALSWMEATALYDFQKSIAPHKPLAELELHFAEKKNVGADYTVAALWQSFLHGVRLATFWVWDTGELDERKKASAGMRYTVWSQPEAAWATAKTALDLRRLSVEASNFPVDPEVLIYYSKPSLILSPRAKVAIKRVYEAAAGLGVGVGFITDKMIRNGALQTTKWLLIPPVEHIEQPVLAAIKQYALGGGAVVVIGKPFRADEYSRPYGQDESVIRGPRVNSVSEKHVPLLANELRETMRGRLERPLELVKGIDESTWPVDYRCVPETETILCYVIGLNPKPMKVRIQGARGVKNWIDLLSGEKFDSNELLINPLDVRIARVTLVPAK